MIEILVPVLGRGNLIDALLDNIAEATTGPYHVTFICSPSDPAREVCLRSDADVITVDWEPGHADFAKKINLAYGLIEEEWYFQGATDLAFREGWDKRALQTGSTGRVGVVGTNDLGNPLVKRGHHATHILFSRAYIEEHGGTYDGEGKVFCELYDHQFVDTEFVQTAILRRQFRASLQSVVEHMHPHWGKGEDDETYTKAMQSWHEDAAIYHARLRQCRKLYAR